MRHRGRAVGLHEDAGLLRAKAAFVEVRGERAAVVRQRDIARLPTKLWRGVSVFQVTCEGPFGRGPHVVWLPERVLWSLIDVSHFVCAYHR